MSSDPQIEFRAEKPGRTVADWLAVRMRHDAAICAGAAVLLIGGGVAVTLMTFLFFWGVFGCGLGRWIGLALALGIVVGMFFLQKRVDGDPAEPIEVDAGPRGRVTLRLSRLTGNSWLMYLDKPAGDPNPVVRFATNFALLGPRLFAVGRRMWERSRQMKSLDLRAVANGLDSLMQSGNRVAIGDLIQEFSAADPQRFIGDLTTIDGVVLLTSEPPSLTLTPSVAEDYEAWKRELRKKKRPAGY